jgi:thiol-disulfide isomerase/thioredoxin
MKNVTQLFWLLSIFCKFFKLSIWISCFRVLFGCNSTFEHPVYLNSGKKWCGSIYLLIQLLSSDCAIYPNLPILLYITVIKLISNIINNFYTYICLSCIFTSISHSLCLVPVLPVVWWMAHVLFTLIVCVCVYNIRLVCQTTLARLLCLAENVRVQIQFEKKVSLL